VGIKDIGICHLIVELDKIVIIIWEVIHLDRMILIRSSVMDEVELEVI
jgi:hypothetical protein